MKKVEKTETKYSMRLVCECEEIIEEFGILNISNIFEDGDTEIQTLQKLNKISLADKRRIREGKYRVYCKLKGIEFDENEMLEADLEEVNVEFINFRTKFIAT
jgi:mRNA-degrading endonuclease RelE of RelBE toxin-antitoxin system